MDAVTEDQWIQQIQKDIAKKQQRYDAIQRTGAVKQEWTCEECGSVLSWSSRDSIERHKRSRKHTQKAKGHIPK